MVLKYDLRKDHKNESGEQGIIIKYNAKGEKSPWRLSTGVYIRKEFFVNGVITDPDIPAAARSERQTQVNLVMKRVKGIIKDFQEDGINEPPIKDVKSKYSDLFNKKEEELKEVPEIVFEPETTYTPITAFEKFIADSKSGERREHKGQIVAPRTIDNYQSTLNILNSFIKGKKYNLDTWDKLDYKFYLAFTNYMFDDLKHFDGNCGKNVKHIKTVLNWAVGKKIIPKQII